MFSFSKNAKISSRQAQSLIILNVLGTGVLYLPRVAVLSAGNGGWLCVAAAAAGAVICSALIMYAMSAFPGKSFTAYCSGVLTKPVGIVVSLIFAAKIIVGAALELRLFGEVVKESLLPYTPYWIVCSVMLALGVNTSRRGYEVRARTAEILAVAVYLPLLALLAAACVNTDFPVLSSSFKVSPQELSKGALRCGYAFGGLDLLLLAYPFINKDTAPQSAIRLRILFAATVTGVIMTVITVAATARYGESLGRMTWPVLTMLDAPSVPIAFMERQSAIVMGFWIVSVFAITNAALFFSTSLIHECIKPDKPGGSWCMPIVALVIFAVSLLPEDLAAAEAYLERLYSVLGIAFLFFIPVLLLIPITLRRLGKRENTRL